MTRAKLFSILNGVISCSTVVLIVALTLSLRKGLIEPVKSGFYCGDRSLYYPIKEEAVPTNVLIAVGVLAAVLITGLSEFFNERSTSNSAKSGAAICGHNLPKWIVKSLRAFLLFLLGLCMTALFVELGKISTGILR